MALVQKHFMILKVANFENIIRMYIGLAVNVNTSNRPLLQMLLSLNKICVLLDCQTVILIKYLELKCLKRKLVL